MDVMTGTAKGSPAASEENDMDLGGLNWMVIDVVCVALLAVVLLWAMLRNRKSREAGIDRTEEATRRLYREEDAARDPSNDDVP
jgi:hypothetical protein